MFTLEQFRSATGVLDYFHAAHELALGIIQHFAMFFGDQGRHLGRVLLQQFLEPEHDAGSLQGRRIAPFRKRGFGGNDGLFHGGLAGKRHLPGNLAGGRVEHILGAPCSGDLPSIDECLTVSMVDRACAAFVFMVSSFAMVRHS